MIKNLKLEKIFYILKQYSSKQLILIIFLTILTTILEILGIGMLLPLLGMFINNTIPEYLNFDFLQRNIGYTLLVVLLAFTLIQLLKFVSSLLLLIKKTNFHWNLNSNISTLLLKNYLNKNFLFFSKVRSSEIIQIIRGETSIFSTGVVYPLIELMIESLLFFCVSIFLFYFNFKISLFLVLFFLILGFLWQKSFNQYLKEIGDKRQFHAKKTIEKIQNGIGNIREIILYNLKDIFTKEHDQHNHQFIKSIKSKEIILAFPKLLLEFLSVVLLFLIFIILNSDDVDLNQIFITISLYVFAIIRIAPSVNKIIRSVQNLKYNTVVTDKIYKLLLDLENEEKNKIEKKLDKNESFNFQDLLLDKLTYKYPDTDKVILEKISISFSQGEKIGIVGTTGTGKTTLINIIAGLIEVDENKLLLNGQDLKKNLKIWQKNIGYISPDTFLVDKSILFNITFKYKEDVNIPELMKVLEIVQLKKFVSKLPEGLDTNVGEEGNKLSLGQRQRIGIARAIFQKPKLLILDEATSFLDETTENIILEKIFEIMDKKTILTVSHRKNPLKFCKTIYEIKNKELIKL